MEVLTVIVSSILSMIALVVGAFLQSRFARNSNDRRQLQDLRLNAYKDYLKCVAENSPNTPVSEQPELRAKLADAKTRIAIFGTGNVVDALAKFERGGTILSSPENQDLFLEIAMQMRRDHAVDSDNVNANELRVILFGIERHPMKNAG